MIAQDATGQIPPRSEPRGGAAGIPERARSRALTQTGRQDSLGSSHRSGSGSGSSVAGSEPGPTVSIGSAGSQLGLEFIENENEYASRHLVIKTWTGGRKSETGSATSSSKRPARPCLCKPWVYLDACWVSHLVLLCKGSEGPAACWHQVLADHPHMQAAAHALNKPWQPRLGPWQRPMCQPRLGILQQGPAWQH